MHCVERNVWAAPNTYCTCHRMFTKAFTSYRGRCFGFRRLCPSCFQGSAVKLRSKLRHLTNAGQLKFMRTLGHNACWTVLHELVTDHHAEVARQTLEACHAQRRTCSTRGPHYSIFVTLSLTLSHKSSECSASIVAH